MPFDGERRGDVVERLKAVLVGKRRQFAVQSADKADRVRSGLALGLHAHRKLRRLFDHVVDRVLRRP